MKRLCRLSISLILVLMLLGSVLPVQADIAPPPFPRASGIYPNGVSTEVRMLVETVEMTIIDEESNDFPDGYAIVKAIFHMLNLGSEPETMDVYFPLDIGNCDENMRLHDVQSHPPIRDFRALVNGTEKPINTIYQRVRGSYSTDPLETDVACWVYFPTIFPVEKKVTIEVSYKVPASTPFGNFDPYIGYHYILHTGAGWKDTIGSADVTVHLPYPITPENLSGYGPDQGISQGRDIIWHFEDFEPDYDWDIYLFMLKPAIWKAIQAELQNTKANPQDGEAWGRLGRAYKLAIIQHKGIRNDSTGEKMYQASFDAYHQAVTLKPDDADWHAGFAELLCTKGFWEFDAPTRTRFTKCVEELKKALELNPQQAKARELLESVADLELHIGKGDKIVDLSGSQPDYLILTPPPPTKTPRATTKVLPTASATRAPTQTQTAAIPPTQTPTPAAVAVVVATEAPTSEPPAGTGASGLCGSAMIPGIFAAIILAGNWQKRQLED